MSAAMPELGSKISLISKADIRYEGRLFTVDPIECTIALAKVRSYGTEDRDTQYPILPQNQVYDYILFRGSDIKDIRVINSVALPNDPAIMQMQLPSNPQPFQQTQFAVAGMGHMGQPMNQSFGNMYSTMVSLSGPNLPPGSSPLNKSKQSSELNMANLEPSATNQLLDQASILDVNSGGSRSTTPTSLTRKSPTHDIATQANQSNIGRDNSRRNTNPRNKSQQRDKDSTRNDGQHQAENKNQQRNQQFHGNNRNWNTNNRGNNQMRGNRPRGRGPPQAFPQSLQNKVGKSPMKFQDDYDFDEAQKKYEELCSKAANLKVNDEANPQQMNGEVDKKDDSGNETGAGEQEVEEDDVTVGYDKTKSFFDNISCEAATDRAKGKGKDWRHERKINSETFGVSAKRGGFYSYRGRGYFNRNTMNTGGYRGNMGYNRGGNYRGRNFNNRSYNTSTGIPQQNNKREQSANSVAAPIEAAAGN